MAGGRWPIWLLERAGPERAVWAVLISALLVGLPIFFEVGFIILVPLVWSLARENRRSRCFIFRTADRLCADGNAFDGSYLIPAPARQRRNCSGRTWARAILQRRGTINPNDDRGRHRLWDVDLAKRMFIPVPEHAEREMKVGDGQPPPPVGVVLLMLVLPVALIVTATVADMTNSPGRNITTLFGHPFTALLVTALLCMYVFGIRRGLDRNAVTRLATDALLPIGTLLAIMGGGGAFKQVIVDSGVGTYAGKMLVTWRVSPLILAYVVAAVLRGAQGSATVAIITAAGIVAPLVKNIPGYSPEMILMALWLRRVLGAFACERCGLLAGEGVSRDDGSCSIAFRTWTAMKMVTSVTGIAIVHF